MYSYLGDKFLCAPPMCTIQYVGSLVDDTASHGVLRLLVHTAQLLIPHHSVGKISRQTLPGTGSGMATSCGGLRSEPTRLNGCPDLFLSTCACRGSRKILVQVPVSKYS